MGRGITTEAVPHAVNICVPDWSERKSWQEVIISREAWTEAEEERVYAHAGKGEAGEKAVESLKHPVEFQIENSGWRIRLSHDPFSPDWETESFGGIYASVLRKEGEEGKAVYAINSSQYSNVGLCELTVFSEDLETLVDFLNDVGESTSHISSPGVAEQWG